MEAVKKLPMISFELKNSPEASSFRSLKQYIAECYHEDPDSYTKEFSQLEQLRGIAVRPRIDFECCATLKRYYAQLHSLQNRFPSTADDELLKFVWKDIYTGNQCPLTNFKYEMASILYNIAALHSQLGIEETRADPESMKIACSHFQCAAWALGELKTQYGTVMKGDLSTEVIVFMQHVCFAQAQECILEKSIADNRKAAIIAKVTAQVVSFYNTAASSLFCQSEDGSLQDLVGSKIYKEWQKYIKFKTSYLSSILFLYQGQHSEEQQKMGERVTLYNAACEKLEEAKKESKGLNKIEIINEALVFTTDVVEGKRKNAKNENDFIYHEEIPDISSISAVQGANLVTGIGFDVTDAEIIGDDIFKRLVPMETHENLSRYSEEKAKILRNLKSIIDERDIELKSFMGSLSMDALNSINTQQERLPQGLVDRCAELSAKPNAIPDLVASMSNLADICSDVEITLKDIKQILDEENRSEQSYQKQMGKRPTVHIMELNREFTKYFDAHNKAGESNDTLRKAMELHVSNLKILSQPLATLQSQVPQTQDVVDENSLKELINLRKKVNEMQEQRDKLYFDLRETILNNDDITKQLVANGEKNVDDLFKKELKKYTHTVNIIEQNLVAQGNILKALTDTYAKYAPILKNLNDTKTKREQFYSSLVASFDVYEDLLSKSSKGLDFYKKLHGNVQKLNSRVKAARDVQSEDRQQMLKTSAMNVPANQAKRQEEMKSNVNQTGSGRKLKDYMKSGVGISGSIAAFREDMNKLPGVRPSPVGQENVPASLPSACQPAMYNKGRNQSAYQQPQGHQELPPVYGNTYYNPTSNDQRSLHSGNSSMSGSSTSLNSDYYNQPPKYAMVAGNNSGASGYVNPMYQTPNYQTADSNAFQQYPQAAYPVANNQSYSSYQGTGGVASGIQTYAGGYQNYQSPVVSQQQSQYQPAVASTAQPQYQPAVASVTPQPQYQPVAPSTPQPQQQPQLQQPKQVPTVMTQYGYQNNYTAAPQQPSVNSTNYSDNYNNYVQPTPAKDQNPQQTNYSQYGQQYQMPVSSQNDTGSYANPSHVQPTSTSVQYTQPYAQYSTPQQQPQTPAVSQVSNVQQYTQYPASDQYNYYNNYQTPQQQATPYNQQNYSCYTPTQNATNSYSYANGESTSVTNSATYDTVNQGGGQMNNAQHQQPTHQDSPQHHASAIPTYTNSLTTATHNSGTTHLTQSQQQISSSAEQNMQQQVVTPAAPVVPVVPVVVQSKNIDLLSCIDFSIENSPMSSVPTLTPMSMAVMKPTVDEQIPEIAVVEQVTVEPPMNPDLANLDILSGIENVSISERKKSEPDMMTRSLTDDVFVDPTMLSVFHKEVETLDKFYDTLTVKTLNGVTPLATKWKELQDLLVRDEAKRSVSVAKLFPDKNRLTDDCLPYDHARVLLMKPADNYINAVLVKDCGHIPFILTQTPLKNTVNDYWEMVWSQKSNTLVCLHTAAEILDPFWPTNIDEEAHYGDVTVVMLKQFEHSQSLERILRVTRHGSDVVMNVSLLQIKTWKKNSAANILDIAGNIITSYKQQNPDDQQSSPLVLNCLTGGSERSGLVTVGISTILAMQMRKPTLLNVVDHWFRICSQRKGALTDDSYIQLSLEIVLNNAQKILNKRGIRTYYQMKNSDKLTTEAEPEIKDSLQELDPFWKFK
ncbi:unnamed protein product [Diamesa hyperborea]